MKIKKQNSKFDFKNQGKKLWDIPVCSRTLIIYSADVKREEF
jgi:hypothetical protein